MANLHDVSVEVLSGIVGLIPAKMCMSATCVEIGKGRDALTPADFDAVANKIRTDMGRFASPDLLESALSQIRERL